MSEVPLKSEQTKCSVRVLFNLRRVPTQTLGLSTGVPR